MQNLRQRYRKPSRGGFQIISYMFNLNVKQALANQICCTILVEYMYIITQNNRKCQNASKCWTLKWHQKQGHFFIHPFQSLKCIQFLKRKFFVKNKLKWERGGGGGWIINYSPFWGPLAFWLDRTDTCTTWLWGLQYKTIIGSLWYLATEMMR